MKHRELESKKPNNFHSFCSFLSSSGSLTLPPPFQKALRNLFSGEENLFLFFLAGLCHHRQALVTDFWHNRTVQCLVHMLLKALQDTCRIHILQVIQLILKCSKVSLWCLFYSPISCQLYFYMHASWVSNFFEGVTCLMRMFEAGVFNLCFSGCNEW